MIGPTVGGGIPSFISPFQIDGNCLKLSTGKRYKIILLFPKEEKQFQGSKDQMQRIAAKVYLTLLENKALKTFETCNRIVFTEKGMKIDSKEYAAGSKYQKLYEELLAILMETQLSGFALEQVNDAIQLKPIEKSEVKKRFTDDAVQSLGLSFLR